MKIGITGGIGSGKTYICKLLQEKGFPIYLCDDNAKRLMQENEEIRRQLTSLIGDAYTPEGLNKSAIAQYLFQSKNNAQKINLIVHPIVIQDMTEWCGRQSADLCFIESAILYETGLEQMMDKTVLVYADEETRLLRAIKRDGTTEEKIKERMAQQMLSEEQLRRADYVIHNNSNNQDIEAEIQKMITALSPPHRQRDTYNTDG